MKLLLIKLLKLLLPKNKYMGLRAYFKKKTPVHILNVYGFDLYQNNNDLDYSLYIGCRLEMIERSADSDVLMVAGYFLSKGDVAIDIGANIGLMSLGMSKFVGTDGSVVSIEPGPISFALLRRNKFANYSTAKNIVLVDAACTDEDGDVPLFINSGGESDNQIHKTLESYEFRNEQPREMHVVKGISLDSKLADYCNPDKVTFVKIDTQGHEWYVLNGAKKLFGAKKSLAILCEFAPYLKAWEKVSVKDFYSLIESLGFSVYDVKDLTYGKIDYSYLQNNYGFDRIGKYIDLLLLKGDALTKFEVDGIRKFSSK
jgi:FkbM family methyltransferase